MKSKIAIGNDHTGTQMKKVLKKLIEVVGYEVINFGSDSDEPVDYPDYAHQVAGSIKKNEADVGILMCGSGQGME